MDSLLGIIIIIAIALISGSNKKKKRAQKRPPAGQSAPSVPKMSAQEAAQAFLNAEKRVPVSKLNVQTAMKEILSAIGTEKPDLVEPEVDIDSDLVEPEIDIKCDLVPPDSEEKPTARTTPGGSLSPRTAAPGSSLPPRAQTTLAQGESARDADGCIGGSLGAHKEEGESRAEHAHHLARAEREDKAAKPQSRRPTRSDLRRAVVMKEILDSPVSMRRRR